MNTISSAVDHMQQYHLALEQAKDMRHDCEAHIVKDALIPTTMIDQILAFNLNQQSIDSLSYYKYIQVEKIVSIDSQNYCILRAPLFTASLGQQLTIATFPICDADDRCLQINYSPVFVVNYATEELYFPDECDGIHPWACQPGVRYDKDSLPCLHGLSNGDASQQQRCPMMIYTWHPPPQPVCTLQLKPLCS